MINRGIRYAFLFASMLCFTQISFADSQQLSFDSQFLPDQDRRQIEQMFTADYAAAVERWAKRIPGRQPESYADLFQDIVDKFGLAEFERFLNLEYPMTRIERGGADSGSHCAEIFAYRDKKFDSQWWVLRALLGPESLAICFKYSNNHPPQFTAYAGGPPFPYI